MKNKEIIKLLDKEIGLALYNTDYRTKGLLEEEYITDAQLKTAEKVIEELYKLKKEMTSKRDELRKMIRKVGKEKHIFFEDVSNSYISDSHIKLNAPLFLLGENFLISGCMIIDPKKYMKGL